MSARIYTNEETRIEIRRLMHSASRMAALLNLRIVIDPAKARLLDFTRIPATKESEG
jgi:hypothetical protein